MTQIITATFENGVLRPEGQLDLPPGTKVQLTVTPFNESRITREQLNYRPTIYAERERLREEARQRIQQEWDATFEQRQKAFEEMERLRIEHPIDTRGERMTRDQLQERR
jgi:predicted DNA-binding antitoxin AbrB/MazE fold protein